MKIVVMGAGVVGVTSAWYLAKAGHEVTVVERHPGAAEETSFANAGLVAPGHAYTWASPRAPKILLKSLWRDDQAFRMRKFLDPDLWRWGMKFLANCPIGRVRVNTARKVRLCLYSQKALHEVASESGVAYDGVTGGLLYLYREQAALDAAAVNMRVLTDNGLELRVLDRAQTVAADPALASASGRIAGAIFAPSDESGDANLFTVRLAEACAARQVRFLYGTTIRAIEDEDGRVARVVTDQGDLTADLYVLALGCQSAGVGRTLGLDIPVYPVNGYSVTLPIETGHKPPTIGGVDESNLVAYARFGDRLRLTATAEFAGYDRSHKPEDYRTMLAVARELFPNAGDWERPRYWAGLRPMTPEGTPIIGRSRIANLYLNTGHGHMGWTMASGSARLLAQLIDGRAPDIDMTGLGAEAV